MSITEVITAAGIHLVVPAAGVAGYVALCRKMSKLSKQGAPGYLYLSYFAIFACYGAALVLGLTALFWFWSGMASIGAVALLFVAPLPMLGQGIGLWLVRKRSKYHAIACWLSIAYAPLMAGAFALGKFIWHG